MADWSPAQYERFERERAQPFFDLLDLVEPRPGMNCIDLGCGTGALTTVMHQRLQARRTLGIDRSPAMLARAVAGAGLDFVAGDIAEFVPNEPLDLVVSNAALQWLDDHTTLFARLAGWLAADGQLAVQMPANFDHPSHLLAHTLAAQEPFAAALGGYVRQLSVLPIEDYAGLLHDLGFARQHVRLQVYLHELESTDAVVEWVKGTLLTDYEKRLPPDLFALFLQRYRAALRRALGERRPYSYAFKRILLWAAR